MKISRSPKLNCTHFILGDGTNNISLPINEVTVRNQKEFKLLAQYNLLFDENHSNWIPFIDALPDSNDRGYGIHCSLDERHEFLKLWISSGNENNRVMLMDGGKIECIISLDSQDLMNNCLISFLRPAMNDKSDDSALTLHANESEPHSDIFYTTFTGSESFGLSKNYKSKLARNADVVNGVHIDRNGQLQFLGDYL